MSVTPLYRTVVADPPWPYDDAAGDLTASPQHRPNSASRLNGPGSEHRYGAMSIAALCEMRPPIDANAHLYLWTTNAFVVEAHEIAGAWGFKPKTICTWGRSSRMAHRP